MAKKDKVQEFFEACMLDNEGKQDAEAYCNEVSQRYKYAVEEEKMSIRAESDKKIKMRRDMDEIRKKIKMLKLKINGIKKQRLEKKVTLKYSDKIVDVNVARGTVKKRGSDGKEQEIIKMVQKYIR